MLNTVKTFISNNLFTIDKPIVCATSGGADSICLLHILHDLGYKVILAHVNHNKRKESIIEEEAMFNLATKLNIPFELFDYHYDNNDNFHNDSHNARYDFFRRVADRYNTNIIATAHHSDDQIETVLMKIMEGSNLYGYGGIAVCNDDGRYKIIRPLLCVNKNQIYEYANKMNYQYFEDSSNQEDNFLRNRLRHHIIPKLKEECPDLNNKILEYSIQAHEAFSYIRKESINYLDSNKNKILINDFIKFDIALKKDIISLLLERFNITKNNNLILNIIDLLDNTNGEKQYKLSNNNILIRSYDVAYIKVNNKIQIEPKSLDITNSTIYNDKYKFYFTKQTPINEKYIKLCYNDIELPFIIRSKQNGDTIELNVGNKKVSRIFIDSKTPASVRAEVPIITDSKGKILWIYDLCKSKDVFEQKNKGNIYLVCEVLK